MDRYSAYLSWTGGDDIATVSAISDEAALSQAIEHARMPWKGWPPRLVGIAVSISLHRQIPGGFQAVGTYEVDR